MSNTVTLSGLPIPFVADGTKNSKAYKTVHRMTKKNKQEKDSNNNRRRRRNVGGTATTNTSEILIFLITVMEQESVESESICRV